MQELWGLDDSCLAALGDVYGFIFLFKYKQSLMQPDKPALSFASAPNVFFANQVINNACATQAILAILLNANGVRLGDKLRNFREFTASLPPDMKGLAISNSDDIRAAHNSFARSEPFLAEKTKAKEDDDVFHFVAYVPIDGQVYELDGLQRGPPVKSFAERLNDESAALHSYGLDAHCRSMLRNPTTGSTWAPSRPASRTTATGSRPCAR